MLNFKDKIDSFSFRKMLFGKKLRLYEELCTQEKSQKYTGNCYARMSATFASPLATTSHAQG